MSATRARLGAICGVTMLGMTLLQPVTAAASAASGCDFDNDGHADLAVGAPGATVQGHARAGVVHVVYGSVAGPNPARTIPFSQASSPALGTPGDDDQFGFATACADIDGDGFDDLAIGAPGDVVNGRAAAGSVGVVFGSPSGLDASKGATTSFHQNSPGIQGAAEAGDRFGAALTVGDSSGDGIADLFIGVPGEDIGSVRNAGAIHIRRGGAGGLATDMILSQNSPGVAGAAEEHDGFGTSLTTGDFNADGHSDLVVGAPGEAIGSISAAGMVNVLYGTAMGYDTGQPAAFHQASAGIEGAAEAGDELGAALVAADFNGDGYTDLAVGVPGEDIGSRVDAGLVNIIAGSPAGLTSTGDYVLGQFTPGVPGASEPGDRFGAALATGSVVGDGHRDLIVGVPGEALGSKQLAGMLHTIAGSPGGLIPGGEQPWYQSAAGVAGGSEPGDGFAASLNVGDYTGDGHDDLAIGVPGEDIGAIRSAGLVNVILGSSSGLIVAGNVALHQNTAGVPGAAAAGNMWGRALADSPAGAPIPEMLAIEARSSWTNRQPKASLLRAHSGAMEWLTIHHAGNQDNPPTGPPRWRSWQAFHMDTRGWGDLAYHYIIGIDGTVSEGRDVTYRGDTGTKYNPDRLFLVVLEGNFEKQDPTAAQLESLRLLLAWASPEFGIPLSTIGGHRDYAATACPGTNLYRYIVTDLPADVAGIIDSGGVIAG